MSLLDTLRNASGSALSAAHNAALAKATTEVLDRSTAASAGSSKNSLRQASGTLRARGSAAARISLFRPNSCSRSWVPMWSSRSR